MASVAVELIRLHAVVARLIALLNTVDLIAKPKDLRDKFRSVRNQNYTFVRAGYDLPALRFCLFHYFSAPGFKFV